MIQLEIRQGAHSEVLARQPLAGNEYGFFDPRPQEASQQVALTPEVLARFQSGAARVRATGFGTSQWLRVPPPVVREMAVEIQRE